ncbi:MAG: translation initiation factor [Duncaniella sp.]|nr:translation initiation factor [Duncaniella sp.]
MDTQDWKSRLAALGSSLPVDDSPETVQEQPESSQSRKDVIEISYERKGRGGKQATILSGFTCTDDELREVAAHLKQRLATGGSARGGEILIQGDCRERVAKLLKEQGYKVKGVKC